MRGRNPKRGDQRCQFSVTSWMGREVGISDFPTAKNMAGVVPESDLQHSAAELKYLHRSLAKTVKFLESRLQLPCSQADERLRMINALLKQDMLLLGDQCKALRNQRDRPLAEIKGD